jgi:hypothetical protein
MNATAQHLLVFVIVATAAAYALLKFMPASARKAVAARVASWAARSGLSDVFARRVEAKLASGGACGSCDSCKACATTPTTGVGQAGDETAIAASSPPGVHRRIPIRRIAS